MLLEGTIAKICSNVLSEDLKNVSVSDFCQSSISSILMLSNFIGTAKSVRSQSSVHKRFDIACLNEALTLSTKISPAFYGKKISFLMHDPIGPLLGAYLQIFAEILSAISFLGQSDKVGEVSIIYSFDSLDSRLICELKSDELTSPDHTRRVNDLMKTNFDVSEDGILNLSFPVKQILEADQHLHPIVSKNRFPYLFDISDDEEEMVVDIIKSIVYSVLIERENILKSVDTKDYNQFLKSSHKIKSHLKSLECYEVVELLYQIEKLVHENKVEELREKVLVFYDSTSSMLESFS